jgi:periplasmic protein TonB
VAPLPDEREIPPPPPQTFEPPPVAPPVVPLVDLTYVPPTPPTAISLPPPPPVVPRETTPPPPPVILTLPRAIEATHTIPEYPALARRLREQGTLRLRLAIDEKGFVTAATLVSSSGFPRLDEAAVKWIKTHWRYAPAMQGAKALSSTAQAIVEFRLQVRAAPRNLGIERGPLTSD